MNYFVDKTVQLFQLTHVLLLHFPLPTYKLRDFSFKVID